MTKDKKSESGCMGCLGLIVLFFISLFISLPIALDKVTENLEGGAKPPSRFEVIAVVNKKEEPETISLYYQSIESYKKSYPDISFDLEPGSGSIEMDEEFMSTDFSVSKKYGGGKAVTVNRQDDDYTYKSTYEVKGGEIYPISYLNFGPSIMGLIIPYALGIFIVFSLSIKIIQTIMTRKKKNSLQPEGD